MSMTTSGMIPRRSRRDSGKKLRTDGYAAKVGEVSTTLGTMQTFLVQDFLPRAPR
jgi:hypothetical protein